ncbi:unnamed protein product [Mytilus coruscus]|uniref:RNA-directed DNA polymerase n=1 Tax=Mytilus coruscus TaxID=42192 RepID=A0A6J8AL69_MYTCO|nr:unnamed protein product [Mytilus coruscus]
MDRHILRKKCVKSAQNTNNTQISQRNRSAKILQLVHLNGNSVLASINSNLVSCLVDSGASVSCCSVSLLENLGINSNSFRKPYFNEAVGVGGEVHKMLGVVTLHVTLGTVTSKQKFHILNHMQQKMILGHDFLKHNRIHLDFDKETLFIPETGTKNYTAVEMNSGLARTISPVTIPPLSQVDIPIRASRVQDYVTSLSQKVDNSKHSQATSLVDKKINKDTLNFNLDNSDLTDQQKVILTHFLNKNRKVFAKDMSELGHTDVYQHKIDTGNAPPIRKRFYRQSPYVLEEMNKQIEELLKYDIIEESNSEWGAPVVMCRKTTGQLRFCCDFRSLNQVSATQFFPLPRLEDVFDSIGKSKAQVFSTLDLFSGYWQCGLDPSTAHKSAFVTPSGVYQWKRRPFGIASAPASFQHMLTHVLHGLNYQMALVYVDDILVFSRNFEEHMKNLQLVFDRLLSAGLTLKPSKCEFAQKEVLYLGHRISREGVKVDQSKVEAVKSFPVPKTETQKEVPFEWSEKCQKSFDKLKDALCSPPVLAYPDLSKPFILTTDASGTAIGYILGQFDSEGRERVCAYNGRSLSQSETKWSISEKECLAVLEGIKNYHVYLANSHFKIYTDHQALNWLSSIKQSTGRLARWYVLLQGYDYEICFRRGSKNTNADCLSRREYPHTDNNLPEPEDSIPSIDVNQISTSEPNNSEPVEITFFFTENPPIQRPILAAIDTPTEFNITTENIGDAQKDCPDFKDMYTYLSNDTLPEEKKTCRQGET